MPAISSTPSTPGLTRLAVPVSVRKDAGVGVGVGVGLGLATVTAGVKSVLPGIEAARPAALVQPSPPVEAKAGASAPVQPLSKEEVAKQVHELQAKMEKLNPALAFVVDQDSGRALIQLTDRATKEVILQFPTEAALQISKALDQFQKGQLLSRTV